MPNKGRILDIGCGFGFFLTLAQDEGWEPFGVDVSAVAVAYCQEKWGTAVQRTDLLQADYPDGHFHAVTMWNVLEHLSDPLGTLQEANRILIEGGLLLVRVPNMVFHNQFRSFRGLLPLIGMKKPSYLGGVAPPQHLYGFTPHTLRLMLNRAGFDVLSIGPAILSRSRRRISRAVLHAVATVIGKVIYYGSFGKRVISPTMVAYAQKRKSREI